MVSPSLWDPIVALGKQENNMNVDKAWELIRSLPAPNFSTLLFLLTLVYKLSLVESNKMNINAFMIVFGPNLIEKEWASNCVLTRRIAEGQDDLGVQMAMMRDTKFVSNYFSVLAATVNEHFDTSIFKEDFPFA